MGARLSLPCPEATEPERPLTSLISELLEEIFLRVACPADLVRVSTARVSFRRLITGQSFLRWYRSIHPPQLLGFFRTPGFLPVEAPHPSAALAQSFARAADFSLDYLPGGAFKRGRRHLADVRDGRVLLECPCHHRDLPKDGDAPILVQHRYEYHCQDIVVCDPLSRRYLLLPRVADELLASVELLGSVELKISGTSLVPSGGIDDTSFSVVHWMQSDKRLGVSIFSSVSGRWSVSTSISCDALGLDQIAPLSGQCISDCFYWKLCNASMLIKLDMNNMQFCTVDLPPGHELAEILIVESGGSKMAMFSKICEGTTVDYYTFSQNGSEESHEWHMERNIPLPARYYPSCFIGKGPAEGFIFLKGFPVDEEDTQDSVFSIDIKSFNIERVISRTSFPARTHPYFGPYMYPRMIQGYGED